MIGKLNGTIEYIRDSFVILNVGGVGYKVFSSPYTMGKIAGTGQVELYIHTYVREDILALYGFLTLDELDMFELLISVSGIGPKAGIGLLSVSTPKVIRTAILNEDPSVLTRVSGVGKKTAERVILELRNKVADLPQHEKDEAVAGNDALEALTTMGYSVSEARSALAVVPKDVKDVGEQVKMALRSLGRK